MRARHQAPRPRSILLTGASSGIGAALAEVYAGPGVHLALGGRDRARLEASVAQARVKGARASGHEVDVTDRDAMAAWVREVDRQAPLDLVIANAGVSGAGESDHAERSRHIFAVNLDGTLNTIEPALEGMLARRRGHLALMSSLAAFRGMPAAPAYCASKAAVRSLGEALRGRLRREGVTVSVICPGFVRTPLTARNPFAMPLLIDPARAARRIRAGLDRGQARIAFPLRLYLLVRVIGALPPAWIDPWLARQPAKE